MALKTVGSVLAENKGIGKGFDFLRVALATMVVFNHSFLIVLGSYDFIEEHRLWTVFGAILPMFFALSGFLISGSAQRLKLKDFLINRSIRIVPALAVDIFVSALLIGTIFTTVSLHDYFLNIVGFIHFQLPGVFLSNTFPDQVNGSLWTVPYEIGCYALMSAMIIFGAIKSSSKMICTAAGFSVFYYSLVFYFQSHLHLFTADSSLNNYINNFVSRGDYLYFDFLSGALIYVLRDKIPYSLPLALVSAAIIIFDGTHIFPLGAAQPVILALPVGYLTTYIGLLPIKKLPFYSRGDYSYGIYLYAFPFQQMLVALFPGKLTVMTNFLGTMALVTGVAVISWHCIEKPILGLRKKFSFTARKGDDVAVFPVSEPSTLKQITLEESANRDPLLSANSRILIAKI